MSSVIGRMNLENKFSESFMYVSMLLNKRFKQGCRRVLRLDGCFLKGPCQGKLLAAVSKDSNNQMFPVAWAVVEIENKNTWKWFIEQLREDLELGDGTNVVIITDMQKVRVLHAIWN